MNINMNVQYPTRNVQCPSGVRSGARPRGDVLAEAQRRRGIFFNHNGHNGMHNGHYFSFVPVVVKNSPCGDSHEGGRK